MRERVETTATPTFSRTWSNCRESATTAIKRRETYIVADESVSRPLGKEAECEHDSHPSQVSGRLEQCHVARRLVNLAFNGQRFANLAICKVDEWITLSSLCVIFLQDGNRLLILSLGLSTSQWRRDRCLLGLWRRATYTSWREKHTIKKRRRTWGSPELIERVCPG